MDRDSDLVVNVRQSLNETQVQFADRLGVGLRSLKRYEIEGSIPRSEAVRRTLFALAKELGIKISSE